MTDLTPDEERLLGRVRRYAAVVVLGLVVVVVLASLVGPILNDGYRVSEVIFGSLIGALLLLVGIEAGGVIFGRRNGG